MDLRRDPGRVGGPLGRSGTDCGKLWVVQNGSRDHRGGPGGFEGPSGRSGMSWETHPKVTGREVGPSRRSRTGCGTLGEVEDGSGDPRKGPGLVSGPSRRSGTGRGTFEEVRDGLEEP